MKQDGYWSRTDKEKADISEYRRLSTLIVPTTDTSFKRTLAVQY